MAAALEGRPPFLPGRDEAYMAVLVDELVTKGTEEPFRMFTSRAEYRLLLREDNADARLTPQGKERGLLDDARWEHFQRREKALAFLLERLRGTRVTPDAATRRTLAGLGEPCPNQALTLAELGRRPDLPLRNLSPFLPELAQADKDILWEAETIIKYSGYLDRQAEMARRASHQEGIRLPAHLDYAGLPGLSREVQEKLNLIRPATLGQAGRIPGVTPAALACVEIHLKKRGCPT